MKKFLAIIAIASFAVACNSSSEKKATTDSPAVKMDTAVTTPIDTAATTPVDTAAKAPVDTAAKTK
jgi:PBP1b-binding outer membrane lipoprotein LpoB